MINRENIIYKVSLSEEFESISESHLIDLISSDDLRTKTGEEEEVFRAVIRWAESPQAEVETENTSWVGVEHVGNRGSSRSNTLHNVLSHVRLPRLSPYFLHDCVATQR